MNKDKCEKHTRLRFVYEDDLALLKEFLSINPTVNPQGWEPIQEHLMIITGKNFSIRTLKQHIIMLLIEVWLKKVKVDQIRSGVKEPQCERDALLQEVHSLCQENKYNFKEKRAISKNIEISKLGKKSREDYAISSFYENIEESETDTMKECFSHTSTKNDCDHDYAEAVEIEILTEENIENCTRNAQPSIYAGPSTSAEPSTSAPHTPVAKGDGIPSNEETKILGPTRKRTQRNHLRKNVLGYLSEKHDKDAKIRMMELDIEKRKVTVMERRLDLDEKKFQLEEKKQELEFKERMMRVEMEKNTSQLELEQKKITQQLLTSQQQIINNLLKDKN